MKEPSKREWELTETGVAKVLADEQMWFRKGTILYKAFELLATKQAGFALDGLYIGKQISKEVRSSPAEDQHSFEAVPLMIYGMALECWLKGLIVMKTPRTSDDIKSKINDEIDRMLESVPEDEFMTRLTSALDHPAVVTLSDRLKHKIDDEDRTRKGKVKAEAGHDLERMAIVAGLVGLTPSDYRWLKFFTEMVMLGRYPAQFRAERNAAWEGVLEQFDVFDRLNSLVYQAYEAAT